MLDDYLQPKPYPTFYNLLYIYGLVVNLLMGSNLTEATALRYYREYDLFNAILMYF